MNALITGGFGYLGSRLAESFKKQGWGVRILARRRPEFLAGWSRDYEFFPADVKDPRTLSGCCAGVDLVIHAAATDEIRSAENELEALLVNGYGTKNVAEEAARASVGRFVYLSTFHVYGASQGVVTEETPVQPKHSYALTHLVGEFYASMIAGRSSMTTTVFRLSNGYGAPVDAGIPRWTLVMNDLCRSVHEAGRIVIKSSGRQRRDFVSIPDIFQALELAAKRSDGAYELYNLGGDDSRSILEIAQIVQAVYEKRGGGRPEIVVQGRDENEPPPLIFSIDKLRSAGYVPHPGIPEEVNRIFDILERET